MYISIYNTCCYMHNIYLNNKGVSVFSYKMRTVTELTSISPVTVAFSIYAPAEIAIDTCTWI